MRLSHSTVEERHFAQWLLDISHGTNIDINGTIPFDVNMHIHDANMLIQHIYPNINKLIPPPLYFLDHIILAPRNSDIDDLNKAILNHFPSNESVFYSADTVETEPGIYSELHNVPIEYLRLIKALGLPPGELRLKKGCPLILLRNLAPAQGLCNSTRIVLVQATSHVLEVKILGDDHNGEISFIPRITLIPSTQPGISFQLHR